MYSICSNAGQEAPAEAMEEAGEGKKKKPKAKGRAAKRAKV
jgi:hypothetical protein